MTVDVETPMPVDARPEGEDDSIADRKMMSLWDHLGELRTRLIRSLIGMTVVFGVTLGFSEQCLNFLKQPLINALPPGSGGLHFTGPLDIFVANLKISLLSALVFSCPVWIYQLWRFVAPALYPRERRYVIPFVMATVCLFFAGIAFCFFVMLPLALDVLINMGVEVGTPIITISDYLSLLLILIIGFGLAFELPVILVLFAMLDLISAESLAEHRRIVIVLILIAAAVLTPPDPLSQVAMAVPLYIMYELSLVIIRVMKRRTKTP